MNHIETLKNNLECIAYGKGITIADIEDGCQLRHGYIARMGNNQKGTIPLEVAIKFAEFVHESIDDLIGKDYSYLIKMRDLELKRLQIKKLSEEIAELEKGE